MTNNNVKKLTLSAIMAALCVALEFGTTGLNILFPSLKLPLAMIPTVIAAVMCGPLWGAATGLVGSFIPQLVMYGLTPTTPLWIAPAAIRGIIAGLLFIAFKRSMNIGILSFEIIVSSLAVTAANTAVMYIDSKLYHYYSYTYVFGGMIPRIAIGILASVILALILPPIVNLIKKQVEKY